MPAQVGVLSSCSSLRDSSAGLLAPLCAPPFEISESVAELLKAIGYVIESDEDCLAFGGRQRQDRLLRFQSAFDFSSELGIPTRYASRCTSSFRTETPASITARSLWRDRPAKKGAQRRTFMGLARPPTRPPTTPSRAVPGG